MGGPLGAVGAVGFAGAAEAVGEEDDGEFSFCSAPLPGVVEVFGEDDERMSRLRAASCRFGGVR